MHKEDVKDTSYNESGKNEMAHDSMFIADSDSSDNWDKVTAVLYVTTLVINTITTFEVNCDRYV